MNEEIFNFGRPFCDNANSIPAPTVRPQRASASSKQRPSTQRLPKHRCVCAAINAPGPTHTPLPRLVLAHMLPLSEDAREGRFFQIVREHLAMIDCWALWVLGVAR